MPNGLLSIFGVYDFYGKSFPGTTMVLGFSVLLPKGTIPLPDITENFLVLIGLLIIILLIGTLLGEVVHTLATVIEDLLAWIGLQARRLVVGGLVVGGLDLSFSPPEKPIVAETRTDDGNDNSSIEPRSPWIRDRIVEMKKWFTNFYAHIVYIFWSHRDAFHNEIIAQIEEPYGAVDLPITGVPFTKRHLLEKAISEYDIRRPYDTDRVYSVVTSTLSQNGHERAFRFQARYSFCRSMWIGLLSIFAAYCLVLYVPLQILGHWTITTPSAMMKKSYLSFYLEPNEIGVIVNLILVVSLVFAWGSSTYKQLYIQYLISGIYVLDNQEQKDLSNGPPRGPAS